MVDAGCVAPAAVVSVVSAGCVVLAAVVSGVRGRCWLCGPCSSCVGDEAVSVGVGLSAIDCQLIVQVWEGLVSGGLGEGNQL